MLIIFDIDCTILQYDKAFQAYWESQGKSPIRTIDELSIQNYSFENMYNESRENIIGMIEEFNKSDEFGKLRSFISQAQMDTLETVHDNNIIVSVTSCGTDRITQLLRQNNLLLELTFELDDLVFLPLGSDKNDAIISLVQKYEDFGVTETGTLFFDNCRKTIAKAKTLEERLPGFRCFLVDHYRPSALGALHNFTEILEVIHSFE